MFALKWLGENEVEIGSSGFLADGGSLFYLYKAGFLVNIVQKAGESRGERTQHKLHFICSVAQYSFNFDETWWELCLLISDPFPSQHKYLLIVSDSIMIVLDFIIKV